MVSSRRPSRDATLRTRLWGKSWSAFTYPGELPAGAGPAHGGATGRALPRMALQCAAVGAALAPQPATHLPAAVWHPIPVPLRVRPLAAEAHIAVRHHSHRRLASRAPPAALWLEQREGRDVSKYKRLSVVFQYTDQTVIYRTVFYGECSGCQLQTQTQRHAMPCLESPRH